MSSVRHVSSIQPRSAAPTGASLQTLFMLVLIDSEHSTVRDTVRTVASEHSAETSACLQVLT